MSHDLLRRVAAAIEAGQCGDLWAVLPDLPHHVPLGRHLAALLRDRDDLAARARACRPAECGPEEFPLR